VNSIVSRRNWLAGFGLAGLLAAERVEAQPRSPIPPPFDPARAQLGPRDRVKITRLEIIPVNTLRTIFIKMHTDAGIVGVGEGTVEGRIQTVIAAIKELEPYLIGKDPRQPAHHWQAIYRHAFYRGDIVLTSALSAVDIAMWDIKGKALGAPVYELLGGPTRDRVRVYGQAESVEATRGLIAEGYTSMKTSVSGSRGRQSRYSENPDFIDGFVEKVGAIRQLAGPNFDIGIEMHGDHSPQTAMMIIKAMEQFRPWFFEEPIQHQNLPLMAEMAKKTTFPFATGERLVTKWQFRDLLTLGSAQLLQPDITHCGGITEMKAIATLGEAFNAAMLPHAKEGIVGAVASMHVMASIPNFLAHELPNLQAAPKDGVERSYLGKSYITRPLTMTEGHVTLAGNFDGPGLGITLDEDLVDNERRAPEWEFPEMWDKFDGSVLDH
jgi:galactonate dehydratase